MPSGCGSGAGVIACAEVVTANAKPATANNLSIVFLLSFLSHALWRVAPNMDQYHYSAERWLNDKSVGAGRWLHSSEHRSEEHTSELQSQSNLVCRLLLEKKKKK